MNNHKLIIGRSFIAEGIQLLLSVFLSDIDGIYKEYENLPQKLKEKIIKHPFREQLYGEIMLISSISETMLFVDERTNDRLFYQKLMRLSKTQMQYALSGGGIISMEEIQDISEKEVVSRMKSDGVKALEEYINIYNNPNLFFEEYGKLLCEVLESSEFQSIFTETILHKLDSKSADMRQEMRDRHPLSYAQSLMGKSFYNIADWSRYEFIPVEISSYKSLRLMDDECNIILYNVNQRIEKETELKDRLIQNIKLISDPKRIEMIKMIYEKPMSGKDIAEALNLTTATVSHHIAQMRKAGFLHEERDKNTKYFSTNKNAFAKITSDLKNYILK